MASQGNDKRPRAASAALVVAVCMALWAPGALGQTGSSDDAGEESAKFARLYGFVEANYADPVDSDRAILEGAVRGMLSTLDPFSSFFNRDQFELLQEQARGKTLGFGSVLFVQPGKVVVLQTAEGSPSWRAGLGPGDEIVEINGARVARLDFESLIETLKRARSQPVNLSVLRPGKLVAEDFKLSPAEVDLPTVDRAFLYSPGIAYLHLEGFESKTAQEIAAALERLGGQELKGALLDLRDNHGGMVDAAVASAGLFLDDGLPVLTIRGRSAPEKTYRTGRSPARSTMPLVILVNGNTASAAEIFAAALEEHDRALVAGERTYGKGVVESVVPLSEKMGLALTTAQYLTPTGRSIQRPLAGTAFEQARAEEFGIVPAGSGQGAAGSSVETPRTDHGRPLGVGGGIAPDVRIPARELDPWVRFLEERGVFSQFAADYLTLHGRIGRDFSPDAATLESFRDFLSRLGIRAPDEYWSADQDFLAARIKAEIFNMVFGLAAGNEVETRADPQVSRAVECFPEVGRILSFPRKKPAAVSSKNTSNP